MNAVDTSVLVAAFASWHEGHDAARAALHRQVRLPAHAVVETYAVLTRLPPPHRVDGKLVSEFFGKRFSEAPVALESNEYVRLVEQMPRHGITGGAIYDALIGRTAATAGLTLLTRDRRAARTYDVVGAHFELVG